MGHIAFEDFKRLVRQLHGSHVLYKLDPVLEQICELNELLQLHLTLCSVF